MKINPMIFENMEVASDYKKNLKDYRLSVQTELQDGKVLNTFLVIKPGEVPLSSIEDFFPHVAQIHTAALSNYLNSGGLHILKGGIRNGN